MANVDTPKVLIVDDDSMVAEDLSEALTWQGKYDTVLAASGDEAVRQY